MRIILLALALAIVPAGAQGAEETLFLRSQPSIPLMSTAGADATVLKRLAADESVRVLGRQAGLVNVDAGGVQGWLREADLTAVAPPSVRVATLETEIDTLRNQLASSQASLRDAEVRARQAQAAASNARSAGADETAALAAERDRLAAELSMAQAELATATGRMAELEMAQEAQRLLANAAPEMAPAGGPLLRKHELLLVLAAALLLAIGSAWFGSNAARRRLRRRYHGLEL